MAIRFMVFVFKQQQKFLVLIALLQDTAQLPVFQ